MSKPTTERPNKYAGRCRECGTDVAAEAGRLGPKVNGKWTVEHIDCDDIPAAPEAAPDTGFAPTTEQQQALDLYLTGASMVIEAGAGTGKTATLKLLAQSTPGKRVQYVAFNRAIVDEAKAKFPANVQANTAHSLAFRAVGTKYSHRLNSNRMTSEEIARILRIEPLTIQVEGGERKTLPAGFLASQVMATVGRFCQTADLEIERRHVPYIDGIDLPTEAGRRTFANNDEVAARCVPLARKAWDDLQRTDGSLRFAHDHYLKMWQLSDPRIAADVILFDEAQDANPVMAAIVAAQTHAQVVYVGDSQQAIYEFTGAVNTLATLDTSHRVFLTQSFRFGEAIADQANHVLAMIEGAELRLVGTPTIPSTIGIGERDQAILTRTNAAAVESVLTLQEQGRRPHLVGGGRDVVAFAKAARDLQSERGTSHPELACFDTWGAVQFYVENDADGSDLKLMVGLVDRFGVETILLALDNMPTEAAADVIVSTAHKAKGREWDTVRLAGDFPVEEEKLSPGELRLIYVAVTRARLRLDITALAELLDPEYDEDDAAAEAEAEAAAAELADRPRWSFLRAEGTD